MRIPTSYVLMVVAGCAIDPTPVGFDKQPQRTSVGPESMPGDVDSEPDPDPDGDPDTSDPVDSGDSGDSGDTGGPPVSVDCSTLPSEPNDVTVVAEARGYHGLVLDDDGRMIGWDGRSGLVAADSDGSSELFVPGVESAEQMVRLDDGRIFLVNQYEFGVDLVTPDGSRSAFVRGLNGDFPYGIVLGPDGKLYVVDGNIYRLDPDTAELTTLWVNERRRSMPHTVGFSLDSRTMYIASVGDGWMFSVELDENLDLVGEPEQFAYMEGGWQDTAVVDICGNIYVADYYTSRIYRVSAEGDVEIFFQTNERGYPHGFIWGTGTDGWDEHTLYAPQPYSQNSVNAYEIGVIDGSAVREWNGVRVGR
ncbi:MAG: hypothetical protein CL927_16620 [Deltaproteobacteria bacterium]|nr:hypothetical protein [Deltaproteobacteria bacterium]HCH65101.1 hypothetical protein [Deltaproteobacteria bacterium]